MRGMKAVVANSHVACFIRNQTVLKKFSVLKKMDKKFVFIFHPHFDPRLEIYLFQEIVKKFLY